MNPVDAWLADRRPVPPRELSARMAAAVPRGGEEEAASSAPALARGLTERGLGELDEARRARGRVRESAYHLLTADALLTYACEAALDAPDPVAVLQGLVGRAASPDR